MAESVSRLPDSNADTIVSIAVPPALTSSTETANALPVRGEPVEPLPILSITRSLSTVIAADWYEIE